MNTVSDLKISLLVHFRDDSQNSISLLQPDAGNKGLCQRSPNSSLPRQRGEMSRLLGPEKAKELLLLESLDNQPTPTA